MKGWVCSAFQDMNVSNSFSSSTGRGYKLDFYQLHFQKYWKYVIWYDCFHLICLSLSICKGFFQEKFK